MDFSPDRRTVLIAGGAAMAALSGSAAQSGDRHETRASFCASYLDSWRRKDLNAIARHLHSEVDFVGPMVQMHGRDAFLRSTERILPLLERFEPRGSFLAGNKATFIYDFVCRSPIGVVRTAELVRFEDNLIRHVELFYDARPFDAAQRAAGSAS